MQTSRGHAIMLTFGRRGSASAERGSRVRVIRDNSEKSTSGSGSEIEVAKASKLKKRIARSRGCIRRKVAARRGWRLVVYML